MLKTSGKVRDVYDIGEQLVIVVSDRISAYDSIMPNEIPGKGVILTQMSNFWLDLTSDIIPNHLISTDIKDMPSDFQTDYFKGRSCLVKKLKMLPVECIVRGYITGSGWSDYKKTGMVCGIKLPEGLQESQKLPEPLFTPSSKAEEGHDENITFDQMCQLIGNDMAERVKKASLDVYKKCADYALNKGIIIADTKFEFGLDENGTLVLADEVLTPDSSRFWDLSKYKVAQGQDSYDKQYLRDWLVASGWDKNPPAPNLPQDVIDTTKAKYQEALDLLTN
ncbi:MAG: phosphoribosylaminoimidazolesuccinocarboxamide synthase [Clostridiales bacterium]|jgi:phosphoribosylaminoimidazole-succinocarboxamide synthase|nr:phosphoribosylaminoimidazolesuccinocarboxamide synthase [Clostridiales bacterium]